MSKSLNLFLPALGGAALLLGAGYGIASRDYGRSTIDTLAVRVEQTEASVAAAVAQAQAAEATAIAAAAERDTLQQALAEAGSRGGDLTAPAPASTASYGLGRDAHPDEMAAWDVDVLPDGRGLPPGSGDVWTGEELFVQQCAACHGDFAEGVDNWPVLAGGMDTLADEDPVKTVGSYWPYLSTAWDYIHRSMPFGAAGTLTADETYAIVAYILYSNYLVEDDFVLSHETFADVDMYNADGFVIDDRPELEYTQWRGEPCMTDCKSAVEITMRSSVLGVTPDTDTEATLQDDASADTTMVSASASGDDAGLDGGNVDPELVAAGERAFRQCASCHEVGPGASNRVGPMLNGIIGSTIGTIDGFRYSGTFQNAASAGEVWNADNLGAFLADPDGTMEGTRMAFRGVRDEAEITALIAYLETFGGE